MAKISFENKTILVTGAAGFIGSYLSKKLLETVSSLKVIGLDCITDYYDTSLKDERLKMLSTFGKRFEFIKADISDMMVMQNVFAKYKPQIVVNLAAQAGVRYSITNPDAYIKSNMIGFYNILECCRHNPVEHLVFASSSSVYGSNKKVPYSTEDKVDNPVSLYAATKKSNELFAHTYSKLYDIPCTGLRFFTVYGPMGRPDMAYFKFTNKMVNKEPIQVYNNGDMYRDFTYIDDVTDCMSRMLFSPPDKSDTGARFKVYNIGNNKPESLKVLIETLEKFLLKYKLIDSPAKKEYLPMQLGDVYQTYADVDDLIRDFKVSPKTSLQEGLERFVRWYKDFYCKR